MTSDLIPIDSYEQRAEILRGNVFGFVTDNELSIEEKLLNLLQEIPLALQVVDEARLTISRLRQQVKDLQNGVS